MSADQDNIYDGTCYSPIVVHAALLTYKTDPTPETTSLL
jgi:hypothetical protein